VGQHCPIGFKYIVIHQGISKQVILITQVTYRKIFIVKYTCDTNSFYYIQE